MFAASLLSVHRKTPIAVSCEQRSMCWFLVINSYTRPPRNLWKRMRIGGKNLFSINEHRAVSRKQLRSFGLILLGGFLVVGLAPMVLHHRNPRIWALAISIASGLAGLLVPGALRRPY